MHFWDMGWQHEAMASGWFLIALVAVIVVFIWRGGVTRTPAPESPKDIVKRRYAAGEIDQQTYERMLDELSK
jgi:uncharacterized membrane protein